ISAHRPGCISDNLVCTNSTSNCKWVNKELWMPRFMCDSCDKVLSDNHVDVEYYSIGLDFKPVIKEWDGWLYVVNFYGQLSNGYLTSLGDSIIVDNAQAYFQEPIPGVDTLYTCRK